MAKYYHILILILFFSCNQTNKSTNITQETTATIKAKTESISKTQTNNSVDLKIIIPKNYSILKESPANGRKMEKLIVDLDNDKKADTAFIVKNEDDFSNYILLIFLTSQNKTYNFKLIDNFDPDFSIYPIELKVKNDVLEVGYFRDGTAAFGRFLKFRFEEKKKTFRLIGYDSAYRSGAGEYCDKSYNLIDGTYIVKFKKISPKEHTEMYKGRKIIEDIYINDIDISLLLNLDKIGSEFEN